MKQVVNDAERLMALLNQAVPAFPQLSAAAEVYFGGGAVGGVGLAQFNHDRLKQAWKAKADAAVLEHGIRTIASVVCGLRALGFPVEAAWAAYIDHLENGESPDCQKLFREVLNQQGFLALAATVKPPTDA